MPRYDQDSPAIQYLSRRDKHLGKVIRMVGPLEYAPAADGYAFLVTQIIGQMLSNKVAAVLTERLRVQCAGKLGLAAINQLTDSQIRQIGISHTKVGYIRNLSAAASTGQISADRYQSLSDAAIIQDLTTIKGIGQWSAKMYLIFVLDRPNVLPVEDVAFLQGYGWVYKTKDYHPAAVRKKCRKWRPYASLAARYLYVALDSGLTKQPFHLFK